jgi:quinolinate synthase
MAEALNLFRYAHFAQLPEAYRDLDAGERVERIRRARDRLGDSTLILGHNYQHEEIYEIADVTGDSFTLSKRAAASEAENIVFCGVTFMAETADILTGGERNVVIPSREAACPMAGMAETVQVRQAWDELTQAIDPDEIAPVTYMNSYADLKAFTGRHDGAICTSSSAEEIFEWALDQDRKILFLPDKHLGHNTAHDLGFDDEDWVIWNPWHPDFGGTSPEAVQEARFILWEGMCQVHDRFAPEHVHRMREEHDDVDIVVHPECPREVVDLADHAGSTGQIIDHVEQAPAGSTIAIGTEVHLINHLQRHHDDKEIVQLCGEACLDCNAMRQIDPNYLTWVLEELVKGNVINSVEVPDEDREWSQVALDRMLDIGS